MGVEIGMSEAVVSTWGRWTGGGDLDSQPTAIFAGIGQCVWDELVGIWELSSFRRMSVSTLDGERGSGF